MTVCLSCDLFATQSPISIRYQTHGDLVSREVLTIEAGLDE